MQRVYFLMILLSLTQKAWPQSRAGTNAQEGEEIEWRKTLELRQDFKSGWFVEFSEQVRLRNQGRGLYANLILLQGGYAYTLKTAQRRLADGSLQNYKKWAAQTLIGGRFAIRQGEDRLRLFAEQHLDFRAKQTWLRIDARLRFQYENQPEWFGPEDFNLRLRSRVRFRLSPRWEWIAPEIELFQNVYGINGRFFRTRLGSGFVFKYGPQTEISLDYRWQQALDGLRPRRHLIQIRYRHEFRSPSKSN